MFPYYFKGFLDEEYMLSTCATIYWNIFKLRNYKIMKVVSKHIVHQLLRGAPGVS